MDTSGHHPVAGRAPQPLPASAYPFERNAQPCPEKPMDFDFIIPVTLFVCIAYAIKVTVDARVRRKMIDSNGSQELMQSIVAGDEASRRHASLRWGIVLVCLAVAFGVIQSFGRHEINPGDIALLLGATGVGNLVYYAIARKLGRQ
jgi:hypothetical protein